jgi:hypothetical protein
MTAGATTAAERPSIRRTLGWALVVSLCVAAATACVALLTGSFDDTDWRVIGTSLGFAAFSSTAAAGAGARLDASDAGRIVGMLTVAASGLAFVLLLLVVWPDDQGEGLWRAWGCAAISALAGSHASLVLRARRREDSGTISLLVTASLFTGGLDWFLGFLPLAGIGGVGEGYGRLLGVLTVLMLLTTGLQPIMRRLERDRPASEPAVSPRGHLAAEVIAAADRIDAIADRPEVSRECARLRALARSLSD